MLFSDFFRTAVPVLGTAIASLLPLAAQADGLAASATIDSTPSGASFHSPSPAPMSARPTR